MMNIFPQDSVDITLKSYILRVQCRDTTLYHRVCSSANIGTRASGSSMSKYKGARVFEDQNLVRDVPRCHPSVGLHQ
jgi:hypothetical protein